ncbi:MAG: hypothetical protein DMG29_18730, partial [Acidobacteria bacterium]
FEQIFTNPKILDDIPAEHCREEKSFHKCPHATLRRLGARQGQRTSKEEATPSHSGQAQCRIHSGPNSLRCQYQAKQEQCNHATIEGKERSFPGKGQKVVAEGENKDPDEERWIAISSQSGC